ncbi:calcineurin-like phosphoesterase [Colletotrichum gloeosporioides Cg-14]|uniref:Sphingomyelin phosphodiesterase n=1 Tax=Colletotrichum gloeosporioides (strain Cg-14) TaxID=1237896 RepID=T0LAI1_COLGC|nr:calcineurin-like phosphoesterase [Colletotrichum gloeosporioides Cg-14]
MKKATAIFSIAGQALCTWALSGYLEAEPSSSIAVARQAAIPDMDIPQSVEGIWDSLTGNNHCLGCQGILLILRTLANFGDDTFVGALQKLCNAASSEDEDVCNGTLALEGPVIAASLRDLTLGSKTAQVFCTTLLGLCDYPEVEPYTVPMPPKTISSPPLANTSSNGTKPAPFKIAHFSDIHIDPLYVTGSNANCSKPMCCRPYTPADEPGNNDFPAGPFGDHNCGAPLSLEQSMYAAINALSPDFALFTGDIVDHAIWNTTVAQNSAEISMAYQHMSDAGLQIYGTVGNHEMSPANAIPPTHLGAGAQWLYDVVSEAWSRWIGSPAEAKAVGAYSVKTPRDGLRVISVSTNFWYTLNFWMYKDVQRDPSDHLKWLVGELDAAEKAGERVLLVGHMPMGTSDALHDGSNYFDQVVNRYKDTIAGLFFGNYSNYTNRTASNAVATSYIAPSMTPLSGMPAFRLYTIDPTTFGILDIETYVADMTDPTFQTSGPVWKLSYAAKKTFGALLDTPVTADTELTPAFWHNVTVALENDPAAFEAYWARRTRGWNVPECDDTCRKNEVCQLRAARSQDNCFVPTPGMSFGIRSEDGTRKPAECDRSVARETIGSLAVRKSQMELLEALLKEYQARK